MRNVVILGGGFGGIRAALDLSRKLSAKEATITLIDRNSYHLFLPALYEIGSAYGAKPDRYNFKLRKAVCVSYADIFKNTKVNLVQAEVSRVDLAKKEITTNGDEVLNYDHLVFALGSETDTFNVPGAAEYAFKFKTIDEALFINQRILELYQKAAQGRHTLPIKFLIVGAGFNGIELAAELACCVDKIKNACKLHKNCVSIEILEAAPHILPAVSEKERGIIRARLEILGVKITENAPIKEVGPNFVTIGNSGQTLFADIIIWTAGARASSFLKKVGGLHLDARGRLEVNNFMQADCADHVWALGDNAVFVDQATKKPVPGLAYVAVDQGKIVAENIASIIRGRTALKEYKPFYEFWIAPVGGKFAVAHLGQFLTISGFWGWLLRMVVDLRYFLGVLPLSKALNIFEKEVYTFSKND